MPLDPGYNYVAARPLYIGQVRAFNTGQEVPDSTIAAQGWVVGVDVTAPGQVTPSAGTRQPSSVVEGVPLWGYGESYMAMTYNAIRIFFDRLRIRIQPSVWANFGVGGMQAGDLAAYAYGSFAAVSQGSTADSSLGFSQAGTWVPGVLPGGVVVLDAFGNDARNDGITANSGTTAKSRAGAANGLEALIRLLRSQQKIANTDGSFTYDANWASIGSVNYVSAGTVHYTLTQNAVASRVVTVPASGEIAVILCGLDDATNGSAGAAYSIGCTGKTAVTGTTSNQYRKARTATSGNGIPPMNLTQMVGAVFTGLTPGANVTVTITKTDANGSYLYFDSILLASPTPPTVLVNKVAYVGTAGYATYISFGGVGAGTAKDDIYNGIIDTVVAKFPADSSVITFDPNFAGWNPATMIGNTDGASLHPNDAGNAFYADQILTKLNTLPARAGLVRV